MVDRDRTDFILRVLHEATAGKPFKEIANEHGADESTLREWDKSFGGMTRAQITRVRQLEEENASLTRRVAELDEEIHTLNRAFARMLDGAI